MNKISFPKQYEELTCEELGIEDIPDVYFRFWKNPSKPVVTAIADVVLAAAEEIGAMPEHRLKDLQDRYYEALSELIIDCNVESLDFSTPESSLSSFEAPDIPIGFVHQVVSCYMAHLLRFNEDVKKALAWYLAASAFGEDATQKESQ